jgi:hypothetical protein
MKSSEAQIQAAISDFKSQENADAAPSIREVATNHAVSHVTLGRRLAGGLTNKEAHLDEQRLNVAQEKWLTNWIIEENRQGMAPSYDRVRAMAQLFTISNGNTTPIGIKWVNLFKSRNPEIATSIGRRIEAARVDSSTKETLESYFKALEEGLNQYNIKPANM